MSDYVSWYGTIISDLDLCGDSWQWLILKHLKSPLIKKKSEKIKLQKKNFLEKNWYVITNKLSCQKEEGLHLKFGPF